MATFTVAIANSINVFGPAPSNKWAQYNWNAFKWGEGTNGLVKLASKALTETLSLADAFAKSPTIVVANTLSPTSDMTSEQVYDAYGWYRLFPGGVANGEDRASPTWTAVATTAPTWTSGTVTSTTWSAA